MSDRLRYVLSELRAILDDIDVPWETASPIEEMINDLYTNHKRKQEEKSNAK